MQGDREAYDRGTTLFSPDGRLYQVEYAREAVERGAPVVGVRASDAVVLAADKPVPSPLMEAESVHKLHRVDDRTGVAAAGNVADGRQLVDVARRRAAAEELRYGQPVDAETLTHHLTDHVQAYTQTGGARPFGTALLVAGVDRDPDGAAPALYEVDPGGTPSEWRATAVGRDADAVRDHLEAEYDEPDRSGAVDLALSALAGDDGLAPETTPVGVVEVGDGTVAYGRVETQAVRDRLAELDCLAE
jgi:proteasome alpha subunit